MPDPVRIRTLSAFEVDAGDRSWVFVKLETDEPGLVGWGEATLGWQGGAVVAAVDDLAALLVGEDALRTEHLWQTMYRQLFYRGGSIAMSALSGVDQALWDVKGKALGVPVYELLGGRVRDHVRAYDHLYRWTLDVDLDTMDGLAEAARRSVADGFDAVKIYPVPVGPALHGSAAMAETERYATTIREAIGPATDLLVDLHGRTTPAQAIAYAALLEPVRPLFLEEPCQPENVDAMVEVARAVRIPIATGERLFSRWDVRELLERRGCAILQPDVANAGGISEVRRIAAQAETYYVGIAPHCPAGPIAMAATVQLCLATPNVLMMEQLREDVAWRDEIVDAPVPIVAGRAQPTTRPGLGVNVLEEAAREHPPSRRSAYREYGSDGAVLDD